jgi:hypothetical protein
MSEQKESTSPHKMVLLGLECQKQPVLPPHNVLALPSGLVSLYQAYDVFDADLVVLAPSTTLFHPPSKFSDAQQLAYEMAYDGIIPYSLAGWMFNQSVDGSTAIDTVVTQDTVRQTVKHKSRVPAAAAKPRGRAPPVAERREENVLEPDSILQALVACGSWLLRRSFDKGLAGPQDVIVFTPPCSRTSSIGNGPYESHCTAALMENWLGLKHRDTGRPHDADRQRLIWTPHAALLGWPSIFDLDQFIHLQNEADAISLHVSPNPHTFERGARIAGMEPSHALQFLPSDATPDTHSRTVQWIPLIASPDQSCVVAGVYTTSNLRIHVLPAPRDYVGIVEGFVKAKWRADPGAKLQIDAPRTPPISSIRIHPLEPPILLSRDRVQHGTRRGSGWVITVNDTHHIGIGDTQFLQLLAFIAADRAGQTAGVNPVTPAIGKSPIKHVFLPSDGYRGRFPREGIDEDAASSNPSLPQSRINKLVTRAYKEFTGSNDNILLIVAILGTGCYRLNPEYRDLIHVDIKGGRTADPAAKALVAMVDPSKWILPPATPPPPKRLWYDYCPDHVEPDCCV